MPPEKDIDPTASPWHYLACRLRFFRNRAGWKQGELGARVHSSASFVSAVETGERRPSAEFMRDCDRVLGADGELGTLFEMANRSARTVPAWLVGYLDAERLATRIRTYQPQIIPGLLQAEAYSRASIGQLMLPSAIVDQRVEERLARQCVFWRENPPRFWAVIDEAALQRLMVNAELARIQLAHIRRMLEQPHVIVEVLPMACGLHACMDGSLVLLDLPNRGVVGYVERMDDGLLVTEDDRVTEMERRYDLLRAETLSASRSVQLMNDLLESVS